MSMQISPQRHEFILENFETESGVVLPSARLVYGTTGNLNSSKSNAILLGSHYMADMTGYTNFIGHDKALDPSKYFIVTTEMFGNGRSSSPSNTPAPYDGPRFPVTTIRDNVRACHEMLVRAWGIKHLIAVMGFSMGAQQAFQWAVTYPDFMDGIVATAGTAKTYGHGIVRLEGQIAALTSDPTFNNGEYTSPPTAGLRANGIVWLGWLYSQEWWKRELWRIGRPKDTTLDQVVRESGENITNDANDVLIHMRSWQRHDVSTGFDSIESALASIKVPVLYMPAATDLYFPLEEAEAESKMIKDCRFHPIPSLWGHPAGIGPNDEDRDFITKHVRELLSWIERTAVKT